MTQNVFMGRRVASAAAANALERTKCIRVVKWSGDLAVMIDLPTDLLVPAVGFEPTAFCSGGRRSIP